MKLKELTKEQRERIEKYEVVSYRDCDCNDELCPGEKVTVLFVHKDKPMCIDFMMRETLKNNVCESRHYPDDKDKLDVFFYVGKLKGIKRLRVQRQELEDYKIMEKLE